MYQHSVEIRKHAFLLTAAAAAAGVTLAACVPIFWPLIAFVVVKKKSNSEGSSVSEFRMMNQLNIYCTISTVLTAFLLQMYSLLLRI